jgi:hypothetical protein
MGIPPEHSLRILQHVGEGFGLVVSTANATSMSGADWRCVGGRWAWR